MRPAGPPPLRRRRGVPGLRGLVLGEAGPGPAWVLAAVALLSVLVAMAGPRELAVVQTGALQAALGSLPGLDSGPAALATWEVNPGAGNALTPERSADLAASIGAALAPPTGSPAARRWAAVTAPAQAVLSPARHALLSVSLPTMEVAYRSNLRANSRLVSGSLPDAVAPERGHAAAGRPAAEIFEAAVTPATAARFVLQVGSLVHLGAYVPGSAAIVLRISGIVAPAHPGSAFWQADPLLAAPQIPASFAHSEIWTAGALVGPAELIPLQRAFAGGVMHGEWYFPQDLHALTQRQLPQLLGNLGGLTAAGGGAPVTAAVRATGTGMSLNLSASLGSGLAGFLAQQQAAGAIDALLIADVLIAALLLMAVGAALAVGAHRAELTLIRARGGAAAQVASRMLRRAACLVAPAAALGAGLAIVAVPAAPDGGAASWVLGGLAALAALASPAVIAAWVHRRPRPASAGRADLTTLRPSRRRLVAELTVLVAAAGGLAAVRLRGVGPDPDPYTRAAPVLAAAAAALIAARLYPVPVRTLLRIASGRAGAVGFLGLARAARSRLGAIAPALVLVVSLTLATFGTMIESSVSSGQSATAWQQVGADVLIQAPGNAVISPAARRAVGAVRGVRRTAAVYTAPGSGPFAAVFLASGGRRLLVALVLARPAQYAALALETPWPRFPAGVLARRPGSAVPVLVSAQVADSVARAAAGRAGSGQAAAGQAAAGRTGAGGGQAAGTLIVDGARTPVAVAATIGDTPAMPGGGAFVVLPAWAAGQFPSIPGPDTLLATGTSIDLAAVRAAAVRAMPGAQLASRAQVLGALQASPAQLAAARIYRLAIWVAALLSVIALLFGLAVSARSRARLIERLTALGMASRQAQVLAVTEVLPLLSVAVLGTLIAGVVLAAVIGPVLDLAVFTGSAGDVPVRPGLAVLLPAAGIIVLAVVIVAVQGTAFVRRNVAAALRQEEAR